MAQQNVTLNPGESEVVSFEATPHEAKTYQVSVDGLSGSFVAIKAVVEITGITVSKARLSDGDAFTIGITFSNPFAYDVWVRPQFSFGKQAVLSGYSYDSGFEDNLKWVWVDLGGQYSGDLLPEAYGSNMTPYVYDPEDIPMVTGEHAYLKVPAKDSASTSLTWHISTKNITHSGNLVGWREISEWQWEFYCGCIPGDEYAVQYCLTTGTISDFGITKVVKVNLPNPLDIPAQTIEAFYAKYSPKCGTFRGKTVNYKKTYLEAISGVLPEGVVLVFDHSDYYQDISSQHRHYYWKWQRFLRLEEYTPIFEDATPPDWW